MGHGVFVSLPTARGVEGRVLNAIFDMRTALEKAGHEMAIMTVDRMPLDLARNELAAKYLNASGPRWDVNLLLDDDVRLDPPEQILTMLAAIDGGGPPDTGCGLPVDGGGYTSKGCDVVSAPCLLRDHTHGGAQDFGTFNVRPIGARVIVGAFAPGGAPAGVLVDECEVTGLGAVLVRRTVMQKLFDTGAKYASRLSPGEEAADIFTPRIAPARSMIAAAPADVNCYVLDDMVFSSKVRALGFKIHAALEITTVHAGMVGNFEKSARRFERAQAAAAAAAPSAPAVVTP